MSNTTTSLDQIAQLKAEIAKLEQGALQELMERRNALSHDLATVDAEIAKLTGKPAQTKTARATAPKAAGKSPSLQELKELLAQAPEKTLSVRKEGLDLANIKTLAAANPQLLKMSAKGPWPMVTLLK